VARVREKDARISAATVYRTMKLLSECGLAAADSSATGQTATKPPPTGTTTTTHLHRLRPPSSSSRTRDRGAAVRVAKKLGSKCRSHKMELYGHCAECQSKAS